MVTPHLAMWSKEGGKKNERVCSGAKGNRHRLDSLNEIEVSSQVFFSPRVLARQPRLAGGHNHGGRIGESIAWAAGNYFSIQLKSNSTN